MPTRLSGIVLPNKRVVVALTYIYGVGATTAARLVKLCGIDANTRADDLTEAQAAALRAEIEKMPHEGDLRRRVQSDMSRLQEIGSYRGYRHRRRLPCRGQRTQTNCRTRKGKRVTVANKKIATK